MKLLITAGLGLAVMACSADNRAPEMKAAGPSLSPYMKGDAMLVFSETKGWRHNQGIAGASYALVQLAEDMDYAVFTTEDSAVFKPENLARFKVVVFNNMSGPALTTEQQSAFETWFAAGGAIVAIHGAGATNDRKWDWFTDRIIGPRFTAHPAAPQFQTARVAALAPGHPVLAGVPDSFAHNEEWYSFDSAAQTHGMTPILGVDESTYSPRNDVYGDYQDLRMDLAGEGPIAHPVAWSKCHGGVDGPRSVYISLGHQVGTFDVDNSEGFPRLLLKNALNWSVKNTGKDNAGCAP